MPTYVTNAPSCSLCGKQDCDCLETHNRKQRYLPLPTDNQFITDPDPLGPGKRCPLCLNPVDLCSCPDKTTPKAEGHSLAGLETPSML